MGSVLRVWGGRVTALEPRVEGSVSTALARHRKGTKVGDILATTDHKVVGYLYLSTSFTMFLIGGLMAMIMRAQLMQPGSHLVTNEQYNELFTMHGSIILLLGFVTPGGSAAFGWFAYAPLNTKAYSPEMGADLWIMGLILSGFGTILTSVNLITTIICMRAPGMTMFRMPIFTWNVLLTSVLVILAFPVLTAALFALESDRKLGTHVFDAHTGGALLWQHLFWFFGHPEVYIVALPFFGIVTEILPVFSRKPVFGYLGLVAATITIAGLSMTVWAHHMFATGQVLLPFFSLMSFMIAVPTGLKFFNWIGTIWRGHLVIATPMLFALGFLVTFLFGGLTGVILASPPLDFQLTDSYFVVGHFHYVLFGTVVFAMFGGFYFWWPKMTGKMLNERWGKIHFWSLFVGFHTTFLVQHWLGAEGMQRRIADYPSRFEALNFVSSIGAFILGASTLAFLWNVWITHKHGQKVHVDDPWEYGNSLEWATTCPPPRHNFTAMPRIRSERPAFDMHHPNFAERKP
jgi:cytochrome c oxidase subunit 1